MTAVSDWDADLFRLLDEDDALNHPSWCDKGLCTVEREGVGGDLTGFHNSRQLAAVGVHSYEEGDLYLSIAQFAKDTAPTVNLVISIDDCSGLVPLALGDLFPLVAALADAAEVVR